MPSEPTFRALGPYTTAVVMDDMRKLILFAIEIEQKTTDVRVRHSLETARALYERVFEEHGGKLDPVPWLNSDLGSTATPANVMPDVRKLIWLGTAIELKIIDVRVRQKLATARAIYERVYEESGGCLVEPCPWAKGAPETVGTANPGIKWDEYDPRAPSPKVP